MEIIFSLSSRVCASPLPIFMNFIDLLLMFLIVSLFVENQPGIQRSNQDSKYQYSEHIQNSNQYSKQRSLMCADMFSAPISPPPLLLQKNPGIDTKLPTTWLDLDNAITGLTIRN